MYSGDYTSYASYTPYRSKTREYGTVPYDKKGIVKYDVGKFYKKENCSKCSECNPIYVCSKIIPQKKQTVYSSLQYMIPEDSNWGRKVISHYQEVPPVYEMINVKDFNKYIFKGNESDLLVECEYEKSCEEIINEYTRLEAVKEIKNKIRRESDDLKKGTESLEESIKKVNFYKENINKTEETIRSLYKELEQLEQNV